MKLVARRIECDVPGAYQKLLIGATQDENVLAKIQNGVVHYRDFAMNMSPTAEMPTRTNTVVLCQLNSSASKYNCGYTYDFHSAAERWVIKLPQNYESNDEKVQFWDDPERRNPMVCTAFPDDSL